MKKYLNIKNLSNLFYGLGLFLATISIYKTIKLKISLPPGVCPINNQKNIIYISIGFFLISILLDLIFTKRKN